METFSTLATADAAEISANPRIFIILLLQTAASDQNAALNQQQGEKLYRRGGNSSYKTTLFLLLKIYPISTNRISCSCTMKRWETNHGKRSWTSRNEFNFHWLAIASTPDAGGFRLKEEQWTIQGKAPWITSLHESGHYSTIEVTSRRITSTLEEALGCKPNRATSVESVTTL